MFPMDDADELSKLVGIQSLEVVVLVDVGLEIVEERPALTDDKLPVTFSNTYHLSAAVAHLPVEEVVLALFSRLTQQGRAEGDAIKETGPSPNLSLVGRGVVTIHVA